MYSSRPNLADQCRALRCPVPEEALAPLELYLDLLMRHRRVVNLVGAATRGEALALCADSFFAASFLEGLPFPENAQIWDLGAGAGLPGIPLRMVWRRGEYTMVESREKRALFLRTALAHLKLPRVDVAHERAEKFFEHMKARGKTADCIISRAFMPWQEMLPFVRKALGPGGRVCIFANFPPPFTLPEDWEAEAQCAYTTDRGERRIWALRRKTRCASRG